MGSKSSNINKGQNNRSDGHLLEYFRSTFGRGIVSGAGGAASSSIKAITASGGTESTVVGKDGKTYKVHTFTTVGPNPFIVSSTDPDATCYVVLQGGGGGGQSGFVNGNGQANGGGGGGTGFGAYFQNVPLTTSPGSYTITVGSGGAGGPGGNGAAGSSGGPSSFSNPVVTVDAGGGGGGGPNFTQQGGQPGSSVTVSPTNIILLHGCGSSGSSGGSPDPHVGSGGVITDAVFNSPHTLLYTSPNPLSGKGNGGPGSGAGPAGVNGSDGYVKVFYQIPA